MSEIEAMQRATPRDVLKIAEAYRDADVLYQAAVSAAAAIDLATSIDKSAYGLRKSITEPMRQMGEKLAWICTDLNKRDIQRLFGTIAEILKWTPEQRNSAVVKSHHRRWVVARAYAIVWKRLKAAGKRGWRPTHAEVRTELRNAMKRLIANGEEDSEAVRELKAIVENKNLSRYSGRLKFEGRMDRGRRPT